jgi:hypothetical protein
MFGLMACLHWCAQVAYYQATPSGSALLDWRRTRPVVLSDSVGPYRACRLADKPSLREVARLNPVDLRTCSSAHLASLCISKLERKAEPRAVALGDLCPALPSDSLFVVPH